MICGVLSALVIFLVVGVAVICFERRKNKTKKGTKLAFQSPHSAFCSSCRYTESHYASFLKTLFCFLVNDFFIML